MTGDWATKKNFHSRLPKKTLKGLILPFYVIEKHQDLYVLEVLVKVFTCFICLNCLGPNYQIHIQ